MGKEADLASHRSGKLKINQIMVSEQAIKLVKDIAIVSVKMQLELYDESPFGGTFRYTRVWKKVDGRLQVIIASCVVISGI